MNFDGKAFVKENKKTYDYICFGDSAFVTESYKIFIPVRSSVTVINKTEKCIHKKYNDIRYCTNSVICGRNKKYFHKKTKAFPPVTVYCGQETFRKVFTGNVIIYTSPAMVCKNTMYPHIKTVSEGMEYIKPDSAYINYEKRQSPYINPEYNIQEAFCVQEPVCASVKHREVSVNVFDRTASEKFIADIEFPPAAHADVIMSGETVIPSMDSRSDFSVTVQKNCFIEISLPDDAAGCMNIPSGMEFSAGSLKGIIDNSGDYNVKILYRDGIQQNITITVPYYERML